MKEKSWFLIADATRARLLEWDGHHLAEIADFAHPEGHLRNQDMVSDQAGRKGSGDNRPGFEFGTSPKDREMGRFAIHLAGLLKQGLNNQIFHHLVLVAPPRFLGCLRRVLDPQVAKAVMTTLDHDFLDLSPSEILHRIRLGSAI